MAGPVGGQRRAPGDPRSPGSANQRPSGRETSSGAVTTPSSALRPPLSADSLPGLSLHKALLSPWSLPLLTKQQSNRSSSSSNFSHTPSLPLPPCLPSCLPRLATTATLPPLALLSLSRSRPLQAAFFPSLGINFRQQPAPNCGRGASSIFPSPARTLLGINHSAYVLQERSSQVGA